MSNNFFKTNKGRSILRKSGRNRATENNTKHSELLSKLNKLHKEGRLWGFGRDMHRVLTNGSRPFTEKMCEATAKFLMRPEFDEALMVEARAKVKPLVEKVKLVYDLVLEVDSGKASYYLDNYSAKPFVESVKKQVETKYRLSSKQMETLNKVYKKYLKRKEKMDAT